MWRMHMPFDIPIRSKSGNPYFMTDNFIPDTGILQKYAHLLLHYCLQVREGQRLFISSTGLAEPLLQAIHREATHINVAVEYDLSFR